ncbi:uncharacterized protein BDZ83DRAFT_609448 [Colletotrichum acutatum]|uniref:Uncharacterized protein n=1 Tax=Glomerella acutata TaxID=27357 RepID=A0AAD8UR79_GLOAC|nr:uncharacterized protein BDZ83DRAFT_609448 [Colletotrichum acutatum]KAK1728511.1 hypothetical protein BDZ83DRAFT_609448 [Colletotrichum acutatum]
MTAFPGFPIPAGLGSPQSEASSETSVTTTHLNHCSTLEPPARSKYEFHSSSSVYSCTSESSDEDSRDDNQDDNQNDSRCLRWANSVDLMNSKQQPPPLNVLVDKTQNLPENPNSVKQLRIISSWGARAVNNPEEDPWWLPEFWGSVQDLTDDLVEYLSKAASSTRVESRDVRSLTSRISISRGLQAERACLLAWQGDTGCVRIGSRGLVFLPL